MQIREHAVKKFMATFDRYENLVIDSTMSKEAKKCFRKYFYRHVLGRVPLSSPMQVIFDFGSAYHKFRENLEVFALKYDSEEKAFAEAIAIASQTKLAPAGDMMKKYDYLTLDRLLKSCAVAFKHWQKDRKVIEVIAVEQAFTIQLTDGSWIGGRIDQVVRWGGKLWIRDFKTTSKEPRYFSRGLDPNDQACRYTYALAKLSDSPVQGVLFELMYNTKTVGPQIPPLVVISKTREQLIKWEEEQIFFNTLLNRCRELDIWPMCDAECSFCDYAEVCRKPNEFTQIATLKQNYALKPWDHASVEQKEINDS